MDKISSFWLKSLLLAKKYYPRIVCLYCSLNHTRRKCRSFKCSGVSSHISVGTNAPVFPFNYFTRSTSCRLYISHQVCHKVLLIFSSQNRDMIETSDVQISDFFFLSFFLFWKNDKHSWYRQGHQEWIWAPVIKFFWAPKQEQTS